MKRAFFITHPTPAQAKALRKQAGHLAALATTLATALLFVATPALGGALTGALKKGGHTDYGPHTSQHPAQQTLIRTNTIRENNVRRLVVLNERMGCDLSGVTLTDAHLIGADLRNASLQFANLTGSNLEGADLRGANLTGANFTNTFLTNACLAETQLEDVNFTDAHLYYVDVEGASISNLNLAGAELLETPISVGGEEQRFEEGEGDDNAVPLEPIIPFEETTPVEPYEPLLNPIL